MTGEVVHVELPAEDPDRAERFWSGVFGWSFQGSGMLGVDYRMTPTREGASAAIYACEQHGHPKFYFATDDIDSATAKVRELGGSAEDKQPVPSHGWFAACTDSEGNPFHLWQADASAG